MMLGATLAVTTVHLMLDLGALEALRPYSESLFAFQTAAACAFLTVMLLAL
ncbi:MAG: hypothetical protein LC789_11755 [Actinobacteria bacterium]|nr:hypothetical protein [Actinomycetota bacterium]MCA1720022.1 hypothetical protein [Actinomycetota bacterium]